MKWFYADQGQQKGPVEESALNDLVLAGVVRDDTLVWNEGMPTWQTHGSVRGAAPASTPLSAAAIDDRAFIQERWTNRGMLHLVVNAAEGVLVGDFLANLENGVAA